MTFGFSKLLKVVLMSVLLSTGLNNVALAEAPGCVNAKVIGGALLTDVCWSCVFPIRVAGVTISGDAIPKQDDDNIVDLQIKENAKDYSNRIPKGAANQRFCMCTDNQGVARPGVVTSLWQPAYLVEYQRVSGCSSVLNGIRLPFNRMFQGTERKEEVEPGDGQKTFRHYHFYSFPIMLMLDMWVPSHCNPGSFHDLDVMYLSEVDPTWNSDMLAYFTNFETTLIANPVGMAACIPDAPASMMGYPIETLWWCAGSWGAIYPLSGNVNGRSGILRTTSLMATRTIAALHRRGVMWGTMGEAMMCGGEVMPRFPKTQYRMTLMYPMPETSDSHVIGEPTMMWGTNRTIPSVGEDPIYIIWRWIDCCNS